MCRGAERLGLIESRRALCCRLFWRVSEEISLIVWNHSRGGGGGVGGGGAGPGQATGLAGSAGASRSRWWFPV